MPISHKQKIIFIHLIKTGGNSIEVALNLQRYNELYGFEDEEGNYFDNTDGVKLNNFIEGGLICLQHLTALQIKKRYSEEIWDSYFKFAFVRNPWDLVVSLYSYITQKREDLYDIWGINNHSSFEEFIVNAKIGLNPNYMFLYPQYKFITDEEENIIVDFVGRFENIEDDFKKICQKINIDPIPKLPKTNISERTDYRDYYNETTKNKIAEIFAKDIELFGYEF